MQGRISSLMVSMALAFFLWLSLAGQDTSLRDFTVDLQPHSLPDHLLIMGEIPKEVILRIQANAAQMRFLSDRQLILPLDLSLAREGYNAFQVLMEPLHLPRGVEVVNISPAAIEFEALGLSQKEVPIKLSVTGQPAPNFLLEGLTFEPLAVTIQGPPEILAQVDHLETTPLAVDGLTQGAIFTVNLVPPEGNVTILGTREIQVTANISEVSIQAVFSGIPVEIEVRNMGKESPASFIARPAGVSVTISWPSSRSQPVKASEVRAQVNVDGEQLKAEGRIDVPVVAIPPDGAEVKTINPATVRVSHVPPAAENRKTR